MTGEQTTPEAPVLSDLVNLYGLYLFTAQEFHHGRLPLWNPHNYAGSPLATTPKYSLFYLIYWLYPEPVSLAYVVLLKSIVAGMGAYLFFRRVLQVGFWPAAVGAWCYPLTGFFVFWQGFPLTGTVAWLPWLLLAADAVARRPMGWGGPALAAVTALLLLGGQLDVAGQALLVCGLFFVWRLGAAGLREALSRSTGRALMAACGGWTLGFCLAAPYLLPLVEYTQTGARILSRAGGKEERPPGDIRALPQVIVPYCDGAYRKGWFPMLGISELEGASAAYTGLLATLVVAPLAWASRRHRGLNLFWFGLVVLGLAWQLGLPALVELLRLPGLNMMSHNRFVFAASFAILALAVTGLEVLFEGGPAWGRWCLLGATVVAGVGVWFGVRSVDLPSTMTRSTVSAEARINFFDANLVGAVLCWLAAVAWVALAWRKRLPPWSVGILATFLLCELVIFALGVNPQSAPDQFFPPAPLVNRLRQYPTGRVLGIGFLPPDLNLVYRWDDVRGYDGVDPRRLLQVLRLAQLPVRSGPTYAQTQDFVPALRLSPDGQIKVPAVLSMLGVRYFLFVGQPKPPATPLLQEANHWVLENPEAVPRVFVPSRVETVSAELKILLRLAAADFDPRRVAYVEQSLSLPSNCSGAAQVVEEVPTRLVARADMNTPGLLVLADQWYDGWQAYRNGQPVPILRTNYLLRGVELPAGSSTVEFRYEPASLTRGVWLLVAGAVCIAFWTAALVWSRKATAR